MRSSERVQGKARTLWPTLTLCAIIAIMALTLFALAGAFAPDAPVDREGIIEGTLRPTAGRSS
jgi:hypothetical protein